LKNELQYLPDIASAQLPALYENARTSLAECAKVDECKDWSDKAKALASYAKQSQDPALYEYAQRIALRAVRRCGELLEQVKPAPGKRTDLEPRTDGDPKLDNRVAIGKAAGLSPRQTKTALRVAAVPDKKFEQLTEGGTPPTISAMADLGKKPGAFSTMKKKTTEEAEQSYAATHTIGAMRRLMEKLGQYKPAFVAAGLDDFETKEVEQMVQAAIKWFGDFQNSLKRRHACTAKKTSTRK
jgi:hypothetical protein